MPFSSGKDMLEVPTFLLVSELAKEMLKAVAVASIVNVNPGFCP
jgi:hypothetical protein